jgi:hypothetical protein
VSIPAANAASEVTQTGSGAGSSGIISALSSNVGTMTVDGQISLEVAAGGASTATNVTISGGTFISVTSGGTIDAARTKITSAANTAIVGLIAKPSAVGTMVIKSYIGAVDSSADETHTITVVATASVGALSVSDSKVNLLAAGTTINSLTDSDITGIDTLGASVIRNGQAAQIAYQLRDSNLVRLSATGVVGASSSNPLLAVSFDNSFYATEVAAANTDSYGSIYVAQAVANTPATGTITLKYNGAVVATKTVTIVGPVKSIVITGVDTIGKTSVTGAITTAGTATDASDAVATTNAGTFTFVTKDAAGNVVGGQTVSADTSLYSSVVTSVALDNSGATTKYSATAALSGGAGTGETLGTWACSSIEGSGTVGLKITNALYESIKASIPVKCASTPNTYTASLDKASYVPGDIATLTITAKTSGGNAPFTAATLGTASTAELSIVGSQLTAVVAPTNAHTFGNTGSKTYKFIVGATEGSYNMIVDLPKWSVAAGYAGAAQTVAYKVAASSATVSNADVLKSIVSLIASINKQIQALQKLILARR